MEPPVTTAGDERATALLPVDLRYRVSCYLMAKALKEAGGREGLFRGLSGASESGDIA